MRTLSLIILACLACVVFGQYEGPRPPRPVIPGAIPLGGSPIGGGGGGGARPVLRRRPAQQQSQDFNNLPPRRITSGRGGPARRLPPPQQQQFDQSLLQQQRPSPRPIYNEPIVRVPQLPSPPPIPSASPTPSQLHYTPQQQTPQISPRPVTEDADDEEENIPNLAQHLTQSQPPQQIAFRPSPLDDFPIPTRQQYQRPSIDEDNSAAAAPPPPPPQSSQPSYVRHQRPQQQQHDQQSRQQQQEVIRQPIRQQNIERSRQPNRPAVHNTRQQLSSSRPVASRDEDDDKENQPRGRKPEVQNIRKYRVDNEDGSITWGFENDDGTYKEETIGVDCVTRGKYGYYDPDGVRREFSYESGIPCDKRDEDIQENNEGYIDYTNNRYVYPNGDAIDLDNMVKHKARKPVYKN